MHFFPIFALVVWFVRVVASSDECCCCDISSYDEELSRVWTTSDDCESPKKCCDIPTQYECELSLNPTFDGSCGHNNELSYQLKNGGSESVIIPRNGYSNSDSFELKGWFGQRFMDLNGNELQEWCFDNGNYDSFFLFRYVSCNGDYPNWFGRCVFPSANNAIIYSECDEHDDTQTGCDYSEFSYTLPSCFGEIEHINIGESSDYGREVNYRLLPEQKHEWIWCSKYGEPQNPPNTGNEDLMYDGDELSEGDGITPFYLEQCREVINLNESVLRVPAALIRNNTNKINEMKPLSFGISIILQNEELLQWHSMKMKSYSFAIDINYDIARYFGLKVSKGDSWSLRLKEIDANEDIFEVIVPENWSYLIKSVIGNDAINDTFITFVNHNKNDIDLVSGKNGLISEFEIIVKNDVSITAASWIARSLRKKGNFAGFGKISM